MKTPLTHLQPEGLPRAAEVTPPPEIPPGTAFVYQRPWMYPKQLAAIFCPHRYGIIEAGTKTGKTVGCATWLFEQAMAGQAGWSYWWVAPIYKQAEIAYRRFKRALPAETYSPNDSKLLLTLANGTLIWFLSGDRPDSLYGEDVYAAVIDEASRFREDAWYAVRSTLTATRGPLRIIGNVKGRRNWFYRLAREAELGEDPNLHFSKITAYDAVQAIHPSGQPILHPDEIADAKRRLPAHIFEELYLGIPSADEGNPFGIQHLLACAMDRLAPGPAVAYGIDLARVQDWTVLIGLNAEGKMCVVDRWQRESWQRTYERLCALLPEDTEATAWADSTGVGDEPVERLAAVRRVEGIKFSLPVKQSLMEGLAVGIQSHEIGILRGSAPFPVYEEAEQFEYEITRTSVRYSAPEGLHDDCVMALALAWGAYSRSAGWRRKPLYTGYEPEAEAPPDPLAEKPAGPPLKFQGPVWFPGDPTV